MRDSIHPFPTQPCLLNTCSLRPLEKEHCISCAHILASMDPWRSLGYRPEALTRYLSRTDPALARYVIAVEGETAGVICIRYPWLMGSFLEVLAVFAPFQGRGIGKEVILWIEHLTHKACRNVWTTVSGENVSGQRFYAAMGFLEVAVLKDLILSGRNEILLRKLFPDDDQR